MPNDEKFSVSDPSVNNAVNTFYPVSSEKINFEGHNYKIMKVTPDSLVISYTN
jgi:hypothetical protein